jgi:serine/threonine protein kinase
MYELLTGFRPFRADNLSKLLHQVVFATPPPILTYRDDLPEELEHVVMTTMQKEPNKRIVTGNAMAAELTRVYKDLRQKYDSLDNQEHFDLLRTLTFFHEFSHAEIWEVLRASDWHEYRDGEDIVREGEVDDRFYIIVAGSVEVLANGNSIGKLTNGDCFGETSYVRGAKRQASIHADGQVTILRVSSTLMEQVSSACQLRFNKVFLRSLITRLQGSGAANT